PARTGVRDLPEQRFSREGDLPTGRWTITCTKDPDPFFGMLAQACANRIHLDVACFLFQFVMIAQTVVKKIALPVYFSATNFFQFLMVVAIPGSCGKAMIACR